MVLWAARAVTARGVATRAAAMVRMAASSAAVLTAKKWVPEEVRRATAAALLTTTNLRTWADRRVRVVVLRAAATTTMIMVQPLPAEAATETMIINNKINQPLFHNQSFNFGSVFGFGFPVENGILFS